GDMVPWNAARRQEFQEELIRRQIEVEVGIKGDGLYFLDRAIPDNIAYNLYDGNTPSDYLLKSSRNGGYDCVFFLEQLPFYEQTKFRRETSQEAKRLSFLLSEVYGSLGYEVVNIAPMGSAERRAEFIMNVIKDG
ncbi:MAG: ATP-binding protein, partial [Candidatus Aenigmarchaeota archaeon]|nr:ATP-binding protein [Candidatus Aenigmarchaeota archaeon]